MFSKIRDIATIAAVTVAVAALAFSIEWALICAVLLLLVELLWLTALAISRAFR